MSQNPAHQPRLDVRGAIDLSGLGRPATPAPGTPGGLPAPGAYVVDVDTEGFPALVQSSTQHPVVVLLWASWSEASINLARDLGTLADQYAGRLLLARIDSEANPQVAAAFQAQSVPSVVAVLAGQPLPLFQGVPQLDQVRGVLDQVLEAVETGTVDIGLQTTSFASGAIPDLAVLEVPFGGPAEPEDVLEFHEGAQPILEDIFSQDNQQLVFTNPAIMPGVILCNTELPADVDLSGKLVRTAGPWQGAHPVPTPVRLRSAAGAVDQEHGHCVSVSGHRWITPGCGT